MGIADVTVDWRELLRDQSALHAFLDELRTVGDPIADAVIAEANARFAKIDGTASPFEMVYRNMRKIPYGDAISPAIEHFLNAPPTACDWIGPTDTARAQRFFTINVVPVGLGLYCASLPEAYSSARAAAVLARPSREHRSGGELISRPGRRAAETATILRDFFVAPPRRRRTERPPGLAGLDLQALASLRGVRLLHAAVREATGPIERDARFEVAANQEDLLATVLTFSATIVESCRRLGLEPKREDALAYLRLWRFIGVQIGLQERLVAALDDLDTAMALKNVVLMRHRAASDDGKMLMGALLSGFPALVRPIAMPMVRRLAGRDTATAVGVEPSRVRWLLARPVLGAMAVTGRAWAIGESVGASRVQEWFGRRMVAAWIDSFDGDAPAVRPSVGRIQQARRWLAQQMHRSKT